LTVTESAPVGLAFKAYEIEELADVYFFRPLGMVLARAARALGLTPIAVTLVGTCVGFAGGVSLYNPRLGYAAFALLILHGVIDSSDGQLARMTGQTSELGRLLDGAGGYLTNAAIYIAICAGATARGAGWPMWVLMFAAGFSSIAHAQMYDYHRCSYMRCVIDGVALLATTKPSVNGIIRAYEAFQRKLASAHDHVEAVIARRSVHGVVRDEDRQRYRACFYWPVRGWNALGDNTRFYAIGVLAWLHHVEWYFAFVFLGMNAAFALLWLWQRRADRRFLAGLVIG
jgi:phosphatidylglycerophosphate synthase